MWPESAYGVRGGTETSGGVPEDLLEMVAPVVRVVRFSVNERPWGRLGAVCFLPRSAGGLKGQGVAGMATR